MEAKSDELFVVGIGSSAGGVPALSEMLEHASCHKSMCFVIVSHVPRNEMNRLAEILGRISNLKSKMIEDKMHVEHCNLYTIPPNKYVTIENEILYLKPRPRGVPNNCADVFFKSLAKNYGSNAIGVVLSGARVGQDGTEGIKAIKRAGGHTYAQDPATALFRDMPEGAIQTGSVDSILSPKEIGDELSLISWAL